MRSLARYQTAIIDWGIGGLSVYREIKRLDPHRSIVYFSDSGTVPYGRQSRTALQKRVSQVCEFLTQGGIREIVIACNAASTIADGLRKKNADSLRVVDVISSGIRIVEEGPWRKVGIIGGLRTIRSGIYQRALGRNGRRVIGRVAQPLSGMIERGELHGPQVSAALHRILRPLAAVEGLLLACTHYPALSPAIQQILPGCRILDAAVMSAREVVGRKSRRRVSGPRDLFLTTGNAAQSRRAARLAFGIHIGKFEQVTL